MDTAEQRARIVDLLAELRALEGGDRASEAELDPGSMGRLSRMDAIQRQAITEATHRHRHHEIARLEAAIGRIDAGTYGECLRCGEDIDERRLDADPAATLCIACATEGAGGR